MVSRQVRRSEQRYGKRESDYDWSKHRTKNDNPEYRKPHIRRKDND